MKSAIDDMSTHLIGKSVRVTDAFRLGRRGEVNPQSRPRPVLIKLESCWDKRLLLASCRKLKGYSDHKLFIREDLPPEARANRRAKLQSPRLAIHAVIHPPLLLHRFRLLSLVSLNSHHES